MPLLRVSEFCRPGSPLKVQLRLEVTTRPLNSDKPSCSVAWVTTDVLIALSLLNGSLAWLRCGSRKVVLRLLLIQEDANEAEDEQQLLKVFAAPIVATNLGIFSSSDETLGADCWLDGAYERPSPASHVTLRPLGRPAAWPRFASTSAEDTDDFWVYPAANTMMQPAHLLSVYDTNSGGRMCFYEILRVTSTEEAQQQAEFFQSSSKTIYSLDTAVLLGDRVLRLPSLLSQRHYSESHNFVYKPLPHPNHDELRRALYLPENGTRPNERILHVHGTDRDHDLCIAVESAAHQMGYTCWSLRGLAAFAHFAGRTVRTGSLVDQLAGLEAALEEIQSRRMDPCVLHLYDIDAELSSSDDQVRHDQESRIWSKLYRNLLESRASQQGTYEEEAPDQYACRLVVILSTKTPLKPGPWLEELVFSSISLSTPDERYIEYLWGDVLPGSLSSLMHGRTTSEIRQIRQQVLDPTNRGSEEQIRELCEDMDAERRQKTSASVAKVHWDDVGGLAHVRREIMDAIELPLKHPHLFPKNSGRSGILLYGPPGTGKTLVAKAVATECHLPFLSIKGPELLGSYVGESEANVRAVFQAARDAAENNSPSSASILFFDELDSLAPRRGGVGDGGGVMERVVATLFAELDGNATSKGRVFLMGATNRPDLLDPSLLRPGRLDRLVYLGIATDPDERARILAAQLSKLSLTGDALEMSKAVTATLPPRLTGADFSTIASGALIHAVQRLCREADKEQERIGRDSGEEPEISSILQSWGDEKCTPVVRLDDLIEASKAVVPSVSESELERYERLRDEYSTKEQGPIEHDGEIFY